jgi:hypothetical protein
LSVVCCLLSVASGEQKRELMRPVLDPFRPVVFALKYCRHGEAYLSPPNFQPPTDNYNQQLSPKASARRRSSQTAVILILVPLANLKFTLTTDNRQPTTDWKRRTWNLTVPVRQVAGSPGMSQFMH